jgi:hypothetical protein
VFCFLGVLRRVEVKVGYCKGLRREERKARRRGDGTVKTFAVFREAGFAMSLGHKSSFRPKKNGRTLCLYTIHLCTFSAGMNGEPMGGSQFSHVPFFLGEVN